MQMPARHPDEDAAIQRWMPGIKCWMRQAEQLCSRMVVMPA
jgi:hypothetical protein